MDFSGLCPFPLRKRTGRKTKGGGREKTIMWKGVLWYVFPSPEFSTTLCFSLMNRKTKLRPLNEQWYVKDPALMGPGMLYTTDAGEGIKVAMAILRSSPACV